MVKMIRELPPNSRPIDWDKIGQMFLCGASIVQAAASIGINRETLYRRCELDLGITLMAFSQEKYEEGNTALHAAQYTKAIKDKNPTMLIWLGKQRLNQKETLEEKINKEIEAKFDEKMNQVLTLLGHVELVSDLKTDESKINNETKS